MDENNSEKELINFFMEMRKDTDELKVKVENLESQKSAEKLARILTDRLNVERSLGK